MTLSSRTPFAQAAAEAVAARSAGLFAHSRKAVLDVTEIEGVHQMRVASRRLRAALEVFAPALDRKRGRRGLHQVKALAEALGERRDRDVQLELLAHLHEECSGAEQRALEVLSAELRLEQQEANVALDRALTRAKRQRLKRTLARLSR